MFVDVIFKHPVERIYIDTKYIIYLRTIRKITIINLFI